MRLLPRILRRTGRLHTHSLDDVLIAAIAHPIIIPLAAPVRTRVQRSNFAAAAAEELYVCHSDGWILWPQLQQSKTMIGLSPRVPGRLNRLWQRGHSLI